MRCRCCTNEAQHAVAYWNTDRQRTDVLCFCDPDLEDWLNTWSGFWHQRILELGHPLVMQAPQWKDQSLAYWPGNAILPK